MLRDGDSLKAKGTPWRRNGIGVAAALAVMESKDINHGALEFLFTIDEETGLTGANEFPGGLLESDYFLNLDNEETGTLCIGCSGGVKTTARRKVALRPAGAGTAFRIKVSGLKGGHSGVDIHQGRGNALRILGTVLQTLLERMPVRSRRSTAGARRMPSRARPRRWSSSTPPGRANSDPCSPQQGPTGRPNLGAFDPGLEIRVEPVQRPGQVLDGDDAQRIVDLLGSLHHGVLAMSPDVPGLVQDSTNLATVSTKGDAVEVVTSQRSAIESSRKAAARMVATACRHAGFEVEHAGSYPGWKPEPGSDIVRKLQATHERLFGEPAKLIAMHAGLECGVIGEKYPGMQMISFGPTIVDPHSPGERVQISTVESFWKFLRTALEEILTISDHLPASAAWRPAW